MLSIFRTFLKIISCRCCVKRRVNVERLVRFLICWEISKDICIWDRDEFLAFAPFFPEYRPFTEANGGKFTVVPPDMEHFQINFEALEAEFIRFAKIIRSYAPEVPLLWFDRSLQSLYISRYFRFRYSINTSGRNSPQVRRKARGVQPKARLKTAAR